MFVVYNNDKKAKYPECNVHYTWDNCEFSTFADAEEYALHWLGGYSPGVNILQSNKPYCFNGYDTITIKEE
jgi:hypothetical protein